MEYNGIDYGDIDFYEWEKIPWWEVNYTIDDVPDDDFTVDVKANSPEEARQLFEKYYPPKCKVWSVYGK